MSKYTDVDKLLQELFNVDEEEWTTPEIRAILENAPSVTPTERTGEWKWESEDICDNCGYGIPHLERIVGETVLMDSKDWKYCPNCGKKMKG